MCVSCELLDFLSPCDVYEAHDAAHAFLKYLYARITKMKGVILTCGIPGAGKSYYCKSLESFLANLGFQSTVLCFDDNQVSKGNTLLPYISVSKIDYHKKK